MSAFGRRPFARVQWDITTGEFALWMGEVDNGAHRYYIAGLPALTEATSGTFAPPTTILTRAAAQELCDTLWSAGIRPSDVGEAPGELTATKRHLADMQRLVFDVALVGQAGRR